MATFEEAVLATLAMQQMKQAILRSWPAYTGNEDGTVQGSRPNYIYARYPDEHSPAYEVYNGTTGTGWIAGLKIMVGVKAERPDLIQVLSESDSRLEGDSTTTIIYSPLKPHAPQHTWGYSDPVYLLFRQIVNLAVYAAGGFNIQIMEGIVPSGTGFAQVAQTILSLTSHVPTDGARYVLVSVDTSGNIVLTDGSIVTPINSLAPSNIPATPVGDFRLAAIRLYSGQLFVNDTVTSTDIFDLRWPPPIGGYATWADNETPAGLVNSVNTTFTLAHLPVNGWILLFLNGIRLESGAGNDYTLSGTTITMLFAPATGDKLRAIYQY